MWCAGLEALDGGYDLTLTLSQALCETFAHPRQMLWPVFQSVEIGLSLLEYRVVGFGVTPEA